MKMKPKMPPMPAGKGAGKAPARPMKGKPMPAMKSGGMVGKKAARGY